MKNISYQISRIALYAILAFLFFPFQSLYAQDKVTVKGKVTDPDGEAVAGAMVLIKGTASGSMTDGGGQVFDKCQVR